MADVNCNALGRQVPESYRPFEHPEIQSAPTFIPEAYRNTQAIDKVRPRIEDAIEHCGLVDGDTISFHHGLRNGDQVLQQVMRAIIDMGFSNLILAPTSLFPCQIPIILEAIDKGVITRIRGGSVRGELGQWIVSGKLNSIYEARSHSGRCADIETGQLPIDVAFCAASSSDRFGNCNGWHGKPNSMFGILSFMAPDAKFAKKGFVVVTDTLVPGINDFMGIGMQHATDVVVVDSIGDNHGLDSGETVIQHIAPERLEALSYLVEVIRALRITDRKPCVQLGSGMGLAGINYLAEAGIDIDMMIGGVTKDLIAAVNAGIVTRLFNGQCFDRVSAITLKNQWSFTTPMDMFQYGSPYRAPVTGLLDVGLLGAIEIDRQFDVNVSSFSNGIPAKAIGGHTDVARGAGVTIVQAPLHRKAYPIIRERVTTLSTPGRYFVDFIMTPNGMIVNDTAFNTNADRNHVLSKELINKGVPFLSMDEAIALAKTNASEFLQPVLPQFGDKIVGVVKYLDGSVLDSIYEITNLDEL